MSFFRWRVPLADAAKDLCVRHKLRAQGLLPEEAKEPFWWVNAVLADCMVTAATTIAGKAVRVKLCPDSKCWSNDDGKTLIFTVGDKFQRFVDATVSRPWLWWFTLRHAALTQEDRPKKGGPGWRNIAARRLIAWGHRLVHGALVERRRLFWQETQAADWFPVPKGDFWKDAGWVFGDPQQLLFGPNAPFAPNEPFSLVEHKFKVPPGLSYEWRNIDMLDALMRRHWRPVPATRYPDMPENNGHIVFRGTILLQRPSKITNQAKEQDYQMAMRQVGAVEIGRLDRK